MPNENKNGKNVIIAGDVLDAANDALKSVADDAIKSSAERAIQGIADARMVDANGTPKPTAIMNGLYATLDTITLGSFDNPFKPETGVAVDYSKPLSEREQARLDKAVAGLNTVGIRTDIDGDGKTTLEEAHKVIQGLEVQQVQEPHAAKSSSALGISIQAVAEAAEKSR